MHAYTQHEKYAAWLPVTPIAPTESHLDQAIQLADESKYYEANLALNRR